jgi:hypothetical protein
VKTRRNYYVTLLGYDCYTVLSLCGLTVTKKYSADFLSSNYICNGLSVGCEIWSLTLREEYRLRVFENRVLRRIFGPKRD